MSSSPDAAPFLAEKLGELTHPDGTTMHLINFSTFPGQHEEQQQQIRQVSQGISAALVHTLELGGFSVVKTTDIAQPPMLGSHPVIALHCNKCGGRLLSVTPSRDGTVSVPAQKVTEIEHACPL